MIDENKYSVMDSVKSIPHEEVVRQFKEKRQLK